MNETLLNLVHFKTYEFFESSAPYLIAWIALFHIFSLFKIAYQYISKKNIQYKGLISELPGLPLTLMHTVCWVFFITNLDIFSTILFFWWGPGFLISAYIFLFRKNFNWLKYGRITSIACKTCYVTLMSVFLILGLPQIVFTFSVWIITDQINLIHFEKNADRSRRLIEDWWFLRIAYPAFLFIPFFYDTPYNLLYKIIGGSVFIIWLWSLIKIIKSGLFFSKPGSYKDFLRNIVYGK